MLSLTLGDPMADYAQELAEIAEGVGQLSERARRLDLKALHAILAAASVEIDALRALRPPQPEGNPHQAYSTRMLAERWGCSDQHIRDLIASGKLEAFRVGAKIIRIRASVVKAHEGGVAGSSQPKPAVVAVVRTPRTRADDARLVRRVRNLRSPVEKPE